MKLKLPDNTTVVLNQELDENERVNYIYQLLQKRIVLNDLETTLENYFRLTWDKNKTIVCMDIIGYYLSKGNIEKSKHDKEVMSRTKEKDMKKFNDKYINFSNVHIQQQIDMGLTDYHDDADLSDYKNKV